MKTKNTTFGLMLISVVLVWGCASSKVGEGPQPEQPTSAANSEASVGAQPADQSGMKGVIIGGFVAGVSSEYAKPRTNRADLVRQILEPARLITDQEVAELPQKVLERISPYTLDEARQGIPGRLVGFVSSPTTGSWSCEEATKQRGEPGSGLVVRALTGKVSGKLEGVDFMVKKDQGESEDFGVSLSKPSTEPSDLLGFKDVLFFDGQLRTEYKQDPTGKWTVEKSKWVEKEQATTPDKQAK
jgi:hypothetical protein